MAVLPPVYRWTSWCEAYDGEHLVDAKGKEDVRTSAAASLPGALQVRDAAMSKKLSGKAMETAKLAKDFMVALTTPAHASATAP